MNQEQSIGCNQGVDFLVSSDRVNNLPPSSCTCLQSTLCYSTQTKPAHSLAYWFLFFVVVILNKIHKCFPPNLFEVMISQMNSILIWRGFMNLSSRAVFQLALYNLIRLWINIGFLKIKKNCKHFRFEIYGINDQCKSRSWSDLLRFGILSDVRACVECVQLVF